MDVDIQSKTVKVLLPSSAVRVGDRVDVSVDFHVSVRNNAHNKSNVSIECKVSDSHGQLSGFGKDQKSVDYGSDSLSAKVAAYGYYGSEGWVKVYGEMKVFVDGRPVEDASSNDGFNVLPKPEEP